MEFDRKDLLDILGKAGPVLSKAAIVPELGNLWFDKKYVYAYNGEYGMRLELETGMDCGIPGRMLLDLLKTCTLAKISMDVEKGGHSVLLRMGRSKVQLASQTSDRRPWRFPSAAPKRNAAILNLSEAVLDSFRMVKFVEMAQPVQPLHDGIVLIPVKDKLHLYASDNKSLAQVVVDQDHSDLPRFLAPWGFVDRLVSLIEPGSQQMHVMSDCLMVEAPGLQVCSGLKELPEEPDLVGTAAGYLNGRVKPVELPGGLRLVLERALILAQHEEPTLGLTVGAKGLGVVGRYRNGSLSQQLSLIKPPAGDVGGTFLADLIERALGQSDHFVLMKDAFVLFGQNGFRYILASKGG